MKPNEIAAARHIAPRRVGGGFEITRPRLNVALKMLGRLRENGTDSDGCGNGHREAEYDSPKPDHGRVQGC